MAKTAAEMVTLIDSLIEAKLTTGDAGVKRLSDESGLVEFQNYTLSELRALRQQYRRESVAASVGAGGLQFATITPTEPS